MSNMSNGHTGKRVYCRIVDVLNNEFGCNYKGYQRGYWKDPRKAIGVWFPQSSRDPKDAFATNVNNPRNWRNIFRRNDAEVVEYWPTEKLSKMKSITTSDTRVVFAKFIGKSDYVFMGVYRFDCFEGTNARVYKRISEEFNPEEVRRTK